MNGDFENNTAGNDQTNLSNAKFGSLMQNSFGFGFQGNLDIITSAIYSGGPQSGNWFVALTGGGTDRLAMELTTPLVTGNNYTISFYDKSHTPFNTFPMEVGLSNTNNTFGTLIYTTPSPATNGVWTKRVFTFIAPVNGRYLTIRQQGLLMSWVQIDNFSFENCLINLNLGNDTTLCQGETLTLDATTPNASYLWQDNSTGPTFNVTQQGTYWVRMTDSCGSITDTINIDYYPVLTFDLGKDTILCQGETLTLDATTLNATYLWHDNSTSPTFNVTQQGSYWVQVTDSCGSITDTINIDYYPVLTIDLGKDTTLCQGEMLTLEATTPNATYVWQDSSTSSTFNVTQQGIYWVQVTDSCGSTTDTINIGYTPMASIDLGKDTTLCEGELLELDVTTPNATYVWQNNSTSPTFNVTQQGSYWVQVSNTCEVIVDTLVVEIENCECFLYIPNAFTPNNDGRNDTFSPTANCDFSMYHLMIFNRWGEKIYETSIQEDSWNGTYRGKMSPAGVYTYLVTYMYDNTQTQKRSGTITLIY